MIYYIYMYWDENGIPRYVGLSKHPSRLRAHLKRSHNRRLHNKIQKLARAGIEMAHAKVAEGLTHEEACIEERRLIALHKRAFEGGTLWNVMGGGQGGLSPSPEVRAKKSAAAMGHVVTPETRAKVSRGNKGRKAHNKGKPSPLKGVPVSASHKANIKAGIERAGPRLWTDEQKAARKAARMFGPPRRVKPRSAAVLQAQSERMRGEGNHMFGKPAPTKGVPHTDRAKELISLSKQGERNPQYGKPRTPEQNARHSALLLARGEAKRAAMLPEQRERAEKKAQAAARARARKAAE